MPRELWSFSQVRSQTFIVSFFILYICHWLVTRHLIAVADFAGRYDVAHPPPPLRLQRRPPRQEDELDKLVTAITGF